MTQTLSALFQLTPTTTTNNNHTSSPTLNLDQLPEPPKITNLITRYTYLFTEATQLPPPRSISHHIHLPPNSNPINVKSYRYPYSQKTELENQVQAMLDARFIQLSHNPFSSSVLLVKKKDDSWRCCVYYRALNTIIIKDRFSMPTINELLDELGATSWFSKLDLRQGFHQIRMA